MADKRMLELLDRLLERTVSKKAKWEETESKNTFQLTFTNYAVRISGSEKDEVYGLSMFDSNGTMIESATDGELTPISSSSFEKMRTLFQEARRQARGFDSAIKNIMKELE
jgi:hypothetical protein